MSHNAIKYTKSHNVDFKRFQYRDSLTFLANGGKCLYMNYMYEDHEILSLSINTPFVYLPFGLNSYDPAGNGKRRWSADLSFYKMEENEELKCLYDFATKLDEYALDLATTNWEKWFGVKKTREVLRDKLVPLVRESNPPGKYAPTLKVHANPDQQGQFTFKVYNAYQSDEALDINASDPEDVKAQVPGKTKCNMILKFPSLWFTSAGFGWSCRLQLLVIYPYQRRDNVKDAVQDLISQDVEMIIT